MPEQITQLNNQTVDQFVKDNQNKLIVMVFAAEWLATPKPVLVVTMVPVRRTVPPS